MSAEPNSDDGGRVAELMRVNAELAAELRNIALERANAPRPSVLPAARRVAKAAAERESLSAQLDAATEELQRLERHNRELERQVHELSNEVSRLRVGAGGLLRRVWARLRGG